MQLQSPTAGLKTITGYILSESQVPQSNQEDVSESEDEEEETQPEFLDMKEMDSVSSEGGSMFKSHMPASKDGRTTHLLTNVCYCLFVYSFCDHKVTRWNRSVEVHVTSKQMCVQKILKTCLQFILLQITMFTFYTAASSKETMFIFCVVIRNKLSVFTFYT